MEPDSDEILRSRARALARGRGIASTAGPVLDLLEFRLADERYAVEARHVGEVHPLRDLTRVPCTPRFVAGIANVRGRIIPVLDLKKFFDLPERGITDLHRIIIVRGHDLELGLLADTVVGVRAVDPAALQATLPTLVDIRADYLKGITGERLVVLDMERILADPRIVVHEEVEGGNGEHQWRSTQ